MGTVKKYVLSFILLITSSTALLGQMSSSIIRITKTYAQNGEYYIVCTPYDNEEPSLRGTSSVYASTGRLLYTINRGFNALGANHAYLGLSNDGRTVVYVIANYANEKIEGLNPVSIYRLGKLVKSYTQQKITSCNPDTNKCVFLYSNFDKVVDKERSHIFTKEYKKVYKDGTPAEEMFLDTSAVFLNKDKLFITDPQKVVHIIDLKTTELLASQPFDDIYRQLKNISLKKVADSYQQFKAPYPPDHISFFPYLANGDSTRIALAKFIGMKPAKLGPDYNEYKVYQVRIKAYISRAGVIEIESIEADKYLPLDKIKIFFKSNNYDVSYLPTGIDKWYFHDFFGGFRNASDDEARAEKREEIKQRQLEREKRMTQDSIAGVYIPQNLEDCFEQLDKILKPVNKNEMKALKKSTDMMQYYMGGLGLWMRNNWGLWGGSRLQKYFADRGATDPEAVSTIILFSYYDWLKGNTATGKDWEAQHPIKTK